MLVAGRCISTTHEALASTRLTPTVMTLGQAAGAAAQLALEGGVEPRAIDALELRRRLTAAGVDLRRAGGDARVTEAASAHRARGGGGLRVSHRRSGHVGRPCAAYLPSASRRRERYASTGSAIALVRERGGEPAERAFLAYAIAHERAHLADFAADRSNAGRSAGRGGADRAAAERRAHALAEAETGVSAASTRGVVRTVKRFA